MRLNKFSYLTKEQFEKIEEFVETIPTLKKEIEKSLNKQEKINNILSIKSDNEEYNQIITRLEKGCNDLSRKITQKEDEIRKINCDKEMKLC